MRVSWTWKWACIFLLISSDHLLREALAESIFSSDVRLGGGGGELGDGVWTDGSGGRCRSPDYSPNHVPVIGILTHPGDGASGRLNNSTNCSYIAASYVRFVQAAGARVIPLVFNEPREILHKKLRLVNGVLFTGGWAKKGLYLDTARHLFRKILEINDGGQHFPLFAICLGFEILSMTISRDDNILERFTGENQASSLNFMEYATLEGTIFQRFSPILIEKLGKECLVLQNHKYGISPGKFQENPYLVEFFTILTTSVDGEEKVYVSTVQGNRYPVTGFQWHPEKNAFEWGLSAIPHSEDAVQVTQHAANYLISEARKSTNRPDIQKVLENQIYNFRPTYCGKAGSEKETLIVANLLFFFTNKTNPNRNSSSFRKGYDEVYIFP